jgi:hypothetical protein
MQLMLRNHVYQHLEAPGYAGLYASVLIQGGHRKLLIIHKTSFKCIYK